MATYAASKSYEAFLATALSYEVKEKIDVISYEPAYVHSQMVKRKPGKDCITKERAAEVVFRDLGKDTRTFGAFRHHFIAF